MSFHRAMLKLDGFGPNSPDPSGFRLADIHCQAASDDGKYIGLATFRVDCLAIRETERRLIYRPML
jgi:hypothetical protein